MPRHREHHHRLLAATVTFTAGLMLAIPLALLAADGRIWPAVALAAVAGPALAWTHEHL